MLSSEDDLGFYLVRGFNDPNDMGPRVVRLAVGQDIAWDMLPNPLARQSVISAQSFADLRRWKLASEISERRVVLRDLQIAGRSVPDLTVRISEAVARLGVNGMLGFDFFEQFDSVLWMPRTGWLTLRFP